MLAMNDEHRVGTDRGTPLSRDISFWGMSITQFLGAFNDNLYKQLMLLLAIPVGVASLGQDQQDLATIVFSLPFVLFSGYAGFLSDRYSKKTIIVISKFAEIAAMALGVAAFLAYATTGYAGLLFTLFLMGIQSAFFGPGKYGILPELFRQRDLPRANGIILMLTFLAIIFGMVSAGFLDTWLIKRTEPLVTSASKLAIGSAFCVGIAVIGTVTALLVRYVPPAQPDLKFSLSSLVIRSDTFRVLRQDRPLVSAILASSMFWLVSGIAIQAVNSLGIVQLQLSTLLTSIMNGVVGLGIAAGAIIGGRLCHVGGDRKVIRVGLWGIVICLTLLSISWPTGKTVEIPVEPVAVDPGGLQQEAQQNQSVSQVEHAVVTKRVPTYHYLLGFPGALMILTLLGVSAGFFAIPLQVFIQSRPPDDQKGRMIAVMNQANFVAIMMSGVVYGAFSRMIVVLEWPRSPVFGLMALLILPLLMFYRPKLER